MPTKPSSWEKKPARPEDLTNLLPNSGLYSRVCSCGCCRGLWLYTRSPSKTNPVNNNIKYILSSCKNKHEPERKHTRARPGPPTQPKYTELNVDTDARVCGKSRSCHGGWLQRIHGCLHKNTAERVVGPRPGSKVSITSKNLHRGPQLGLNIYKPKLDSNHHFYRWTGSKKQKYKELHIFTISLWPVNKYKWAFGYQAPPLLWNQLHLQSWWRQTVTSCRLKTFLLMVL